MSFEAIEISRSLGLPVNLYKFSIGAKKYLYTDAEQSITYQNGTYTPIPIDRSSIKQSGTLDDQRMQVTIPVSADLAENYRVSSPTAMTLLTILTGHENDPDQQFVACFSGRVMSVGRVNHELRISCETYATALRRLALRRRWQVTCGHPLYGAACKAVQSNFTANAIVASTSASGVVLQTGWNGKWDPSYFANGIFSWGVETRSILQISGDTMVISGAQGDVPVGTTVQISLGCNLSRSYCNTVFNNILNFGGQPWIPTTTPTGNSNRFY